MGSPATVISADSTRGSTWRRAQRQLLRAVLPLGPRLAVAVAIVCVAWSAPSEAAGPVTWTTFTGTTPGANNNVDGVGSAAAFATNVSGIAVDASGNVFVADTGNNTIRKVTPDGTVTTVYGSPRFAGNTDSPLLFNGPQAIAVDAAGTLYVADTNNHAIRVITAAGVVTNWGLPGTSAFLDGPVASARFNTPRGITVDSATGNVYVSDTGNGRIRKITVSTGTVSTFTAGLSAPWGVAVDSVGGVYVAETGNSVIKFFSPAGVLTNTYGAVPSPVNGSPGNVDGVLGAARFNAPRGVALDSTTATLYVGDTGNNKIRAINLFTNVVTSLAGSTTAGIGNGVGSGASFTSPQHVALDSAGVLYVADLAGALTGARIRTVTSAGVVTTLAGGVLPSNSTNAVAQAAAVGALGAVVATSRIVAKFSNPGGVAADGLGNVYVADTNNNTIRRIAPNGTVNVFAGGAAGAMDGTGANARFSNPQGLAVDSAGNVFVADSGNSTIRMITPAGVVTTVAGYAGLSGYVNGTLVAARFNGPQGIAVDGAGNLYISDTNNNAIRYIAVGSGVVITLAGSATGACGYLDATGTAALFCNARGIAVDSAGTTVYVAEPFNFNDIRKIVVATGVVSTYAGGPLVPSVPLSGNAGSADGTTATATFGGPYGLALDSAGNLYVTDGAFPYCPAPCAAGTVNVNNNTIRKITAAGVVTTIGGAPTEVTNPNRSADGQGTTARFFSSRGIAVDVNGTLYVADSGNNEIRLGGFPADHLLDLSSDGGSDVFQYNRTTGGWRFQVENRSTGTFIQTASAVNWNGGWSVFPARLNGDGFTDMFLYNPVTGLWVQALNDTTLANGTAAAPRGFTYTSGNWDAGWSVFPSDLNGDGFTDLFLYKASSGIFVKAFTDGAGQFSQFTSGSFAVGLNITVADLNGDGRDDLFLYNNTTGVWTEAFSQAGFGTFDFPASGTWSPGWTITPADLNGDGKTDLFLLNAATGVHQSALSLGSDFTYGVPGTWELGWALTVGDLNNDGMDDLFLYKATTGVWVQALSNGAGDFTYPASGQWDAGWAVAAVDFNEDGFGDILVYNAAGTWVQARNLQNFTFSYTVGTWGTGFTILTRKGGDR